MRAPPIDVCKYAAASRLGSARRMIHVLFSRRSSKSPLQTSNLRGRMLGKVSFFAACSGNCRRMATGVSASDSEGWSNEYRGSETAGEAHQNRPIQDEQGQSAQIRPSGRSRRAGKERASFPTQVSHRVGARFAGILEADWSRGAIAEANAGYEVSIRGRSR
jgi:hypothetical protein